MPASTPPPVWRIGDRVETAGGKYRAKGLVTAVDLETGEVQFFDGASTHSRSTGELIAWTAQSARRT
ncbi:hypothetical protein [Embleya sp. NBC_00896]|uniref:hypothetical protein n=1 Tax=Embleya sp. NBC_00896 TaxID=2975961 RepID=UPI002F91ADF2|nr:hypothetical protein OG928_35605 [Embleya sp. NBC_00896]